MKKYSFWAGIFREDSPNSSRRLITLIVSAVFILTCINILVLINMVFSSISKLQNINLKALEILVNMTTQIIYYEFMIVISGLALITAPQFAKVLVASIANVFTKTRVTETEEGTTTETYQVKPEGSEEPTLAQPPAEQIPKTPD